MSIPGRALPEPASRPQAASPEGVSAARERPGTPRARPSGPPFVHPTAVVEDGAVLGEGVRVWHFCHVRAGAVLGEGVVLGQGCHVAGSARVGAGSRVQNHVSLYDGVELAEDVFVGPGVTFTNVRHPRAFLDRRGAFERTRVERGATLGAACTLLPGVTVGAYAFVGAGAVVTADVAPHALVLGVPARPAGWVSRAGLPLRLDADGVATCPETGERYRVQGGVLAPNPERAPA